MKNTNDDIDIEWKEELVDNDSIEVSIPVLPPQAKLIKDYQLEGLLTKKSYHSVTKFIRTTGEDTTRYFFKEGRVGSYRSVIEAISSGFSKLIAPEHTASTWAAYNEEYQCIGVLSEEIPDFEEASTAGLTEADLEPMPLSNIPLFEELYDEFMMYENKKHALRKKDLKIDREREALRRDMRTNNITAQDALKIKKSLEDNEKNNFEELLNTTRDVEKFYERIAQSYQLTKAQFDSYRVLKGLAISFVSAIINQDDDFHYNNFTRYGIRFDFDMTLWPILFDYKEDYTKYVRIPHDDMFHLSVEDVIHFPNITSAFPYYWPTSVAPKISGYIMNLVPEKLTEKLMSGISYSRNAYPVTDTKFYMLLEHNEIFQWHKYATLLRYLLTSTDMYKAIIFQHISNDRNAEGVVSQLIVNQELQQHYMLYLLVRIPEFQNFFKTFGKYIMDKLTSYLSHEKIFDLRGVQIQYDLLEKLIDNVIGMEFQDFRDATIKAMDGYINSNLSFFRHNIPLAKGIKSFCHMLEPDPLDTDAVETAMNDLYDHLHSAKSSLTSTGGMYVILNRLLQQLENLLSKLEAKKLSNSQPTEVKSASPLM